MNEILILHGFLSQYQSSPKSKSQLGIIVKYKYQTCVPNDQMFFSNSFAFLGSLELPPHSFLGVLFLGLFQEICKWFYFLCNKIWLNSWDKRFLRCGLSLIFLIPQWYWRCMKLHWITRHHHSIAICTVVHFRFVRDQYSWFNRSLYYVHLKCSTWILRKRMK